VLSKEDGIGRLNNSHGITSGSAVAAAKVWVGDLHGSAADPHMGDGGVHAASPGSGRPGDAPESEGQSVQLPLLMI